MSTSEQVKPSEEQQETKLQPSPTRVARDSETGTPTTTPTPTSTKTTTVTNKRIQGELQCGDN